LTDAEKTAATDAHNAARANVNPPATPSLGNLAWDETLAANASDYASKCIWGHSQNTGNAYPGNNGENLYMSTGAANVADAVAAWVDEEQWYDYNSHSCSPGETCGHYTQIVWRGAAAVGCGYADCTSIDDQVGNLGGVTSGRIVVCQYDDQQTDTKPY
ncbi:MAG: hypothetical protein IJR28_00645, partial [Ottowia sp.]|nr:hypothetical protein [Ottowia sp.]